VGAYDISRFRGISKGKIYYPVHTEKKQKKSGAGLSAIVGVCEKENMSRQHHVHW